MSNSKQAEMIMAVIKYHEKMVRKMQELRRYSFGEIDFGSYNMEDEIHVMHGIKRISDLIGVNADVSDSGIEEYPDKISCVVQNTTLFEVR